MLGSLSQSLEDKSLRPKVSLPLGNIQQLGKQRQVPEF